MLDVVEMRVCTTTKEPHSLYIGVVCVVVHCFKSVGIENPLRSSMPFLRHLNRHSNKVASVFESFYNKHTQWQHDLSMYNSSYFFHNDLTEENAAFPRLTENM